MTNGIPEVEYVVTPEYDLEALRAILTNHGQPAPELIGKLPRITCGNCRDARGKVCNDHTKSRCNLCQNYITSAHMHLDYLGHADVTRALIEIDPAWSWEPVAWNDDGAPATVNVGGMIEMWGRLTLLGVTRPAVGSVERDKSDQGKQLIGDFLRNAAMRFGIALALWSKQEWAERDDHDESTAPGEPNAAPAKRAAKKQAAPRSTTTTAKKAAEELVEDRGQSPIVTEQMLYNELEVPDAQRKEQSAEILGELRIESHKNLTPDQHRTLIAALRERVAQKKEGATP